MVHFTQYHPAGLFHSALAVRASRRAGYPIRQSADHGICAPPRGFSQLITAFFARQLQGIRHKPVFRLTILSPAFRSRVPESTPASSLSGAPRDTGLPASDGSYLFVSALHAPLPCSFKYHRNRKQIFSVPC